MSSLAASRFVVTTSTSGVSRTQLWDAATPLTLGHPLRWIAERTSTGVRIRDLSSAAGLKIVKQGICEIPFDKIHGGAEVDLPSLKHNGKPVSIRIRAAQLMAPAFFTEKGSEGGHLTVFQCRGAGASANIMESDLFSGAYTRDAFSLAKSGDQFTISAKIAGLIAGQSAQNVGAQTLTPGQPLSLTAAQLAKTVLTLPGSALSWRFGFSKETTLDLTAKRPTSAITLGEEAQARAFRKSLVGAAVGLGLFALIASLWPAAQEDPKELVPPQFAKIVMQAQPKQKSAPSQQSAAAAASSSAPEKVQKAAVVQAFRAKALSSAVSGLLKGGMTSLLAQSDFVSGRQATADARNMMNSKSDVLKASGTATGVSHDTNVKVAALGGGGQAGYGQGDKAGVKGQGQGFVSMDIGGATVDEGLTKDEVGEVIHRHLSEVRYCYESAMVRSADIEGKLMVGFTIGGNGVVKGTEVKSSTLPDPRLDDCILRRLASWKFPNPRGGIDVTVGYPFIFKTLGR